LLRPDTIREDMLREYPSLVLAYVGDAVFELLVRTHMVTRERKKVNELHHDTVELVKAQSQARLARQLYYELSEEEKDIVKRGRNAKSTPPKNADPGDYKLSTGFEALLGYLYLKGDEDRLLYLVSKALDSKN